jgi:8-oxo-dGTP pyrophosphatase MutT (NUDIX family)
VTSRRPRRPGPQKIPRPPAVRPGGPAPWPEWEDRADRPHVTTADVRAAVAGVPALPEPDHGDQGDPAATSAAVLAPVFDDDDGDNERGEARIVLTRRTEWMRSHSHQVAFPGGRCEEGEAPVDAALRESFEEIGLDPSAVDVVGPLTTLATISNPGGGIHPFVGVLPGGRPAYDPNPDEVERVFDVAIADLMEAGCYREEIWGIGDGMERPIYFFELDGETIWGATARMLHELLTLVGHHLASR